MTNPVKTFLVDAAEASKIGGSLNEPHAHPFEELIIGIEGQLEHFIDFKTTVFDAPYISFVTKGKVHRVKPLLKDGKCRMRVVRFKSEFIPETTFQLYALYHDNANLVLSPGNCFNRLITLCEMMEAEIKQPMPDYAVIRQLLSTIFTMVESERRKHVIGPESASNMQNVTFRNFLKLLEENFRRPTGVDFYAEKLFMTSRNLNLICQNILQQSVSEIIETRKLTEAKNLLISTEKPVSEIGFELGYNEKAYFTAVFKKKSGQTPTEFREEMKKLFAG